MGRKVLNFSILSGMLLVFVEAVISLFIQDDFVLEVMRVTSRIIWSVVVVAALGLSVYLNSKLSRLHKDYEVRKYDVQGNKFVCILLRKNDGFFEKITDDDYDRCKNLKYFNCHRIETSSQYGVSVSNLFWIGGVVTKWQIIFSWELLIINNVIFRSNDKNNYFSLDSVAESTENFLDYVRNQQGVVFDNFDEFVAEMKAGFEKGKEVFQITGFELQGVKVVSAVSDQSFEIFSK